MDSAEKQIEATSSTQSMTDPIQMLDDDTNNLNSEVDNFWNDNKYFISICGAGSLLLLCIASILCVIAKKSTNNNYEIKPNLKNQIQSNCTNPNYDENNNDDEDEKNIEKFIDLTRFQKSVDTINMSSTPLGDIDDIDDNESKSVINKSIINHHKNESVLTMTNEELLQMDVNIVMPPPQIIHEHSQLSHIEEAEGSTTQSFVIHRVGTYATDDGTNYMNQIGSHIDDDILYEESKTNNYISDESDDDHKYCTLTTKGYDEDDENYKWIKMTLQKCDDTEWYKYLNNFKKHKINEERLRHLPNDADDLWKEVIPEIGIRCQFQSLWKNKQMNL